MNKSKSTLLALAVSVAFLLPGIANALDVCGEEMKSVYEAIDAAVFHGKKADMDESRMLAKYDAAAAKLGLYKFSDAIDKLDDIAEKATALATAKKPKLNDATDINDAVGAAIRCIYTP